MNEHVRRDGTSQRHKCTCNFKCSKLDKLTSDLDSSLMLINEREGGLEKKNPSNLRLRSKLRN